MELARAVDLVDDVIERDGLVVGVAVRCEMGVRRDEVVLAVYLNAVPREVYHRPVGGVRDKLEVSQRVSHLDEGSVLHERYRTETDLPQAVGNRLGIIRRVGEAPARMNIRSCR